MKPIAAIPIFLFIALLLPDIEVIAQSKADIEALSLPPKTIKNFPVDYKILLPTTNSKIWDDDFNKFYRYLTPVLMKTQFTLSFDDKGVKNMVNFNSILPHAQLDTATMISDKTLLKGIWRMVSYRSLRFVDSIDIRSGTVYRTDTTLANKNKDDAFAIFSDNDFKLFAKEDGKKKFKRKISSRFTLENKRYLMLYRYFKSASGVSQLGIDEHGLLIMNYPAVIEHIKPGDYSVYCTVLEQFIFEKIKQ